MIKLGGQRRFGRRMGLWANNAGMWQRK